MAEPTLKEAKKIISRLLQARDKSLTSPDFSEVFTLAIQPQNRKNLILSDVHIALQEYYEKYRLEDEIKVVLKLTEFLSEDIEANYPIAVNGGYINNILRFFEDSIDMIIEPKILAKMDPEIRNTPSLQESYFRFHPDYDKLIGLSHAKILNNLLQNKHTVKWFARNKFEDLRYLLITVSISIQERDNTLVDLLLSAISKLFENADAVKELTKNTYLSNWVFGTMINVCSVDPNYLKKYFDWIQLFLKVEGKRNLSKN